MLGAAGTVPGLVLVDEVADRVGGYLRFLRRDRTPSVSGVQVRAAVNWSGMRVVASGEPIDVAVMLGRTPYTAVSRPPRIVGQANEPANDARQRV